MPANAFNPDRSKVEVYTKSEINNIINTLSNTINARINGLARVKLWGTDPEDIVSDTTFLSNVGVNNAVTLAGDPADYDEIEIFALTDQSDYKGAYYRIPTSGGMIGAVYADTETNGSLIRYVQDNVLAEVKFATSGSDHTMYLNSNKGITHIIDKNNSDYSPYGADNFTKLFVYAAYGIKFPVPYVPPAPPQING